MPIGLPHKPDGPIAGSVGYHRQRTLATGGTAIYSKGDILVYPNYGIVEVKNKEKKEVGSHKVDVYLLETVAKRQSVMVPASTAEKSGLRRVISAADIEKLYTILKGQPKQLKLDWYERFRLNDEKLKTGDLFKVAEVLRDLWHIRETHDKNSKEYRQRLDGLAFLAEEISYVEKRRKSEIVEVIELILRDKTVYDE